MVRPQPWLWVLWLFFSADRAFALDQRPFERSEEAQRILSARVERKADAYEYTFTLRVPPGTRLSCLRVPSAGGKLEAVPPVEGAFFPKGWPDHVPGDFVRWPLWEGPSPETTPARFVARSPLPPALGEVLLEWWVEDKAEEEAERQMKVWGTICNADLREVRRSAARSALSLVPRSGSLGTFEHARALLDEVALATSAGWVAEDTARRWAACVERAVEHGLDGDWNGWGSYFRLLMDLAVEAREGGSRPELCDWAELNASYLKSCRPDPCEPRLSASVEPEIFPVDRNHLATVRLENAATGEPLPNGGIEVEYLDGRAAGKKERIPSRSDGLWTVLFSSPGPGEQRVKIRPLPPVQGPSCFPSEQEVTLRLRWWDGANLGSWIFPSRARLTPGALLPVYETTWNDGGRRAAGTQTAYLVHRFSWPDDAPWRLAGLRIVPPLQPGEESAMSTQLRIPPDLEAGWYWMVTVADWQGLVKETSESDNSSYSHFDIPATFQVRQAGIAGTPCWVDVTEEAAPKPRREYRRPPPPPFEGEDFDPPCDDPSRWLDLFRKVPPRLGGHPIGELDPELWKGAIGRVDIVAALPAGTRASSGKEARRILDLSEGVRIPVFQKTPAGFVPKKSRRLTALVPIDVEVGYGEALLPGDRQEVAFSFPVYSVENGWAEAALDVTTGERVWLSLQRTSAVQIRLATVSGDTDSWEAETADLVSLLREPFLRAYAGPSFRSPWVVLNCQWSPPGSQELGWLRIRSIRNGFGLVEGRSCWAEDETSVLLGWIPLWDLEGYLLVWPTPGALRCC